MLQDLLDFPVPFRPTKAYRWPGFNRSFALERISIPSDLPLPFPLLGPFSVSADLMVMVKPSISSCRSVLAWSGLWCNMLYLISAYLAIVGRINVKPGLLRVAQNRCSRFRPSCGHRVRGWREMFVVEGEVVDDALG